MNCRILVLVTGASRGFGRCVAEEFVRKVCPHNPIDLVIFARSIAGLQSAAGAIDKMTSSIPNAAEVVVQREAVDLGDLERLEDRLNDIFAGIDPGRYSRAVLVNNAGSVGHVSFANDLPSLAKLRSEMDFNATSAIWLSSRFSAIFGAHKASQPDLVPSCETVVMNDAPHVSGNIVINISSLAALQPFESWSGYSAGKACREMFHRVLAKEQESIGGLKVLNYSPGPMMTDMSREIRSDEQFENDVREGKLIDPKLSAEKCVKLALGAKFANGAHVDFFDTEEN